MDGIGNSIGNRIDIGMGMCGNCGALDICGNCGTLDIDMGGNCGAIYGCGCILTQSNKCFSTLVHVRVVYVEHIKQIYSITGSSCIIDSCTVISN